MGSSRTQDLVAMAFGTVAATAYVLLRCVDYWFGQVADPVALAVTDQMRTAYYWRAATACFWGGTGAVCVRLLLCRLPGGADSLRRLLTRSLVPWGVVLALLAFFYP